MSRLQQKRSGIRSIRERMGARATRAAINAALASMGIARPRWGTERKADPSHPSHSSHSTP